MRNSFLASLTEVATEDPNLWLLCGDLGYSVLEPFVARFPERYLNVGVAEQNMAGIAAGLALSGKTVFIYSIGNFPIFRCLEQLRNDVCYHAADVKVVAVGGGYAYGSQGYTHHAVEDVAIMSTLPGMEIFVPCDPAEARAVTLHIATSGRPAYLRLSRAGEPQLHSSKAIDPRRPCMLRQGEDITILASGPITLSCIHAADLLATRSVEASVISVGCLKPLDQESILSFAKCARLLVTVEEHILRGGLHDTIAAAIAGTSCRPRILGLGVPELEGELSIAGSREELLTAAGLSPETIAMRIAQAKKEM
jgi:transketolase